MFNLISYVEKLYMQQEVYVLKLSTCLQNLENIRTHFSRQYIIKEHL